MTEQPPKPRRWVRVLLVLSLALNLLVAGVVGGAIWRYGGPDGPRGERPIGVMLFAEMPRQSRSNLRHHMAQMPHDGRPGDSLRAIADLLRTTPFDAAGLGDVVMQHNEQRAATQTRLHRAWLDQVAAMSDAERVAYADRLERAAAHRHRRLGKRD